MTHRANLAAVLLLFCCLCSTAAEHRGTVQFGGLPVPGATITATQGDKTFTAVTDAQGAYVFSDLPDGAWKLHVAMVGFSAIDRDVAVMPGAPAAEWDLQMLPLGEMKAVTVTQSPTANTPAPATTPAETTTNANQKSRKPKKVPTGPTNTQTPFQRAEVNATAPPPALDANAAQSNSDLSQRATDGFLINGTANNAASSPFATNAAFGNNRRGGRSLYNGNLGFTLNNSALDARPYSLTGQNTLRPNINQFTGLASFGGPLQIPHLLHNGLHTPNIFLNYQWTRNRTETAQPALMPTAAEREGDFSQVLNAGKPVTIFDPTTGQPFAGNIIPSSFISPQARAMLALYPLPNFTGGGGYNYQAPLTTTTHQDALQSRVTEIINPANQLFGIFALQSTRNDTPSIFNFLDTGSTLGLNATANWRHRFTNRLFGTFGVQFTRSAARTTPFFENRQNIAGDAGITGANQAPTYWGPPNLEFASGIQPLTDGVPSYTRDQTSGVSFSGLWNHGRHNFSFGGDFRRQEFNLLSQQDPRGTFGFTGAAAGDDFAGFLLGIPDTSSIAFGNADKYFRASNYDAYIQDDWRVSPVLTLNAGVRWEYWSPITEKYGRLVNLDIAPGFTAETPVLATDPTGSLTGQHYPGSLMNPDTRAIEPRIALSWRPLPASSLVVRSGYGVYYNTSVYFPIASQMAQQSPFSKSLSVQNSPADPLTLANGFLASPNITTNTFAVDPNFRIGYAQIWNVSVQRDLPGSLVLIATYMGIKGTRGMQEFLPNTYPAGAANPCPTCPTGFVYLTSNGNSTRESGTLQLRRRLHNGFTAELDYTYAKAIDDSTLGGRNQGVMPSAPAGGGATPGSGQGGGSNIASPASASATQSAPAIAQNWLDLSAERGLSNFDQRHLVNFILQYTTGMGLGGGTLLGGWRGALFKEWTFLSNLTAGSGLPLTPVYYTAINGTGITGTERPEYTGAPLYAAAPGLSLNPAAYAAPPSGQWGNAGRNSITGPAQFSWNASMGRTFRVNDRFNLDVRFDSINPLNHVTFPSWNTTFNNAQFGLPNAADAMRSMRANVRLRF
ncbi:MAG TPA: carboxypeptidase regulatory-like domain-containing protein [Bryobacteraceae bacterium]